MILNRVKEVTFLAEVLQKYKYVPNVYAFLHYCNNVK